MIYTLFHWIISTKTWDYDPILEPEILGNRNINFN